VTPAMNEGATTSVEEVGFLTAAEECVLVSLRGLVEGIRARGQEIELDIVEADLVSAGAAPIDEAGMAGSRAFRLGGARFMLRKTCGVRCGVEISFFDPAI
jgi:hypothetical protein